MTSLLATVATLPNTGHLDAIDDSTTADSPSFLTAKSALVKLAAEEVDSAFSPLSSSAITIASLGSSLGYGSGAKRHSGVSHARQPVDQALGTDSNSLLDGIEEQHSAGQLGLRGAAATTAQDDSLVTSSGNMSTAVSSSAASSHSSKSSTSSAGPSVGMSKVNMRSVSVDYAHAYGLHIKRTMASAAAGDDSCTSSSSSPAEIVPPRPAPAYLSGHPLRTAPYHHHGESGVSSSTTSLSGIHRSLTKKFWRPLARKSGENDTTAAASTKSAFRQQPLAIDADEENVPLSDSDDSIVAVQGHRYPKGKVHSSQDTCADNGDLIVERNSVVVAEASTSATTEAEQAEHPVLPLDTVAAAAATTPHPSTVAPYQPPRNYRFNRAVASKSLDVPRVAKDAAGEGSKGALNRRVLQRAKREDAIYGVASSSSSVECKGPERFQALSRSFVSRLGFASTLAARRRSDDLRFVIAPHPQFAEIAEVYDCDEHTLVYRKVSRSGRSWHETFHEVNFEEELAEMEAAKQHVYWRQQQHCLQQRHSSYVMNGGSDAMAMSDYKMASALGLPYPGFSAYGGRPTTFASAAAASCVTIQSSAAGTSNYANGGMSNQSTASFLLNSGTVRMARASTSMGGRGFSHASESGASSGGVSFDRGLLWEALTPYPNQFPLHIKDARTIIDTVSLASMVLDRHQFCYRFQMGANRMRWTAKRTRKHQLALVCTVRSTVIAEIFVDYEKGYSPYGVPSALGKGLAGAAAQVAARSAAGFMSSSSSSGVSTPHEQLNNGTGATNQAIDTGLLPEDGSYPVVTILPAAFAQLVDFDSDVVESFIIFTGMQMLECLHM
ncbi:hypothetical protein IW152_003514 [Coemansia sp. BCRC 34962]|nr:hypothetical protein IW152_003514 [Coemansia sp. BCRC 34962]